MTGRAGIQNKPKFHIGRLLGVESALRLFAGCDVCGRVYVPLFSKAAAKNAHCSPGCEDARWRLALRTMPRAVEARVIGVVHGRVV